MSSRKVILITPFWTENPKKGFEVIQLKVRDFLLRQGCQVTVVSGEKDSGRLVDFDREIMKCVILKRRRLFSVLKDLMSGLPLEIALYNYKHVFLNEFDLSINIMYRSINQVNINSRKRIYFEIDSILNTYELKIKNALLPIKLFYQYEINKIKIFNRSGYLKFQKGILINANEIMLRKDYSFDIMKYGVPMDRHHDHVPLVARRIEFAMTGNFNYQPNQESLKDFISEYEMSLQKRGIRIVIAGFGSQKVATSSPIIECFDGEITSMTSFLGNVKFIFVPVKRKIGTLTKALEAMISGGILIAHEHVQFGIPELSSMENCILYKDKDSFERILEVIQDLEKMQSIADKGRNLMLNKYDLNKNIETALYGV